MYQQRPLTGFATDGRKQAPERHALRILLLIGCLMQAVEPRLAEA